MQDAAPRPLAPQAAEPPSADLREQSRQLDCLYNETDRLYGEFARSCGLSECAYWLMYDIEVAGGRVPLRRVAEDWSFSRQTLSSAAKVLESKGLITLAFEEGSRKNKVAEFTSDGTRFSRERIVPASEAKTSAFASLLPDERRTMVRLAAKYADAIGHELSALRGEA